jgi:integrase
MGTSRMSFTTSCDAAIVARRRHAVMGAQLLVAPGEVTVGAAPVRKKAATSDIVIVMAAEGRSLRGLRNRAVLLLGFAGAFRRSELVALNVKDLEETPEGLLITIRRARPARRASAAR